MPPEVFALAPLPPLLAAVFIGGGVITGRIKGEESERLTNRVALYAATISLAILIAAIATQFCGHPTNRMILGRWLESGSYHVDLGFILDGLSLTLATLFALLSVLVLRFAGNYLHREDGFHRFFLVLSLFVGAMLLLTTAGNAALAFIGWELAGICSYLLIAYHYDRPHATLNATRAFVTNRIGDAGFALGIFLAFYWTGGIDWQDLTGARLDKWQAGMLACCFLLAGVAKSALIPLSPWLVRAMEGPTPSSSIFYGAVMIHAGVYLVLRLEPLFEQAPAVMALMAILGSMTALYGFFCGLAQTDGKSALIFSVSAQVGLMFLAAGLGGWNLALWHLCAHAVFRAYQLLAAPSLAQLVLGVPARPVHPFLGRSRRLYQAALQRFWLENLGDWLIVRPVQRLSADLQAFDHRVVEPAFGQPAPAISIQATLAAAAERSRGKSPIGDPEILRVSGLPGGLLLAFANVLHWFEEKLVLQSVGPSSIAWGRKLGVRLNHLETLMNQPHYRIVWVLATLLAVF